MSEIGNVGASPNVASVNNVGNVKQSNYQPKVDLNDPVDTVEFSNANTGEKKASTGKKVGVGIASACLSGLGQVINGQVGKGVGFLAGTLAAGFLFGPIGAVAVGLASVVDAVKNAKP